MKLLYIETQISILEELIMTINPKTMSTQQLLELSKMSRQLSEWSENEIQNRQPQGTAD